MRRFELSGAKQSPRGLRASSDNAEAKVIAGGTALLTFDQARHLRSQDARQSQKINAASDISHDAQQIACRRAGGDLRHRGIAVGAATLSGVGRSVPCVANIRDSQHGHHRRQSGARAIINPIRPQC